jgi:hypothetical protein
MSLFPKDEAKPYLLHTGKHLACVVCGFDHFFNMEWANATAHCSVCGRCGHIHWFLRVV